MGNQSSLLNESDIDNCAAPAEARTVNQHTESLRTPDPCAIVIFGATGDLTKRKLLPALYNLAATRVHFRAPLNFQKIAGNDDMTTAGQRAVS